MVPWFDDNDNNDIIMMMMMMRTMIMWCRGSAEEWADAWRPTTHAITSQMQQFTPDFHRKKLFCSRIYSGASASDPDSTFGFQLGLAFIGVRRPKGELGVSSEVGWTTITKTTTAKTKQKKTKQKFVQICLMYICN